MPSVLQDIDTLIRNVDTFFCYLPVKNIYVAAPENVRAKIESLNDRRLIFVCEDEFVDVKKIRELYLSRTDKNPGRAGWYVQQFIKMAFSRFTQDEYYLIWDSDTIPLRQIDFFSADGRPCFNMKPGAYTPQYFVTMSRILPGTYKAEEDSFVSEHMLVKSDYMRELLDTVESNAALEGRNFQEKIINAVCIHDLPNVGFSEFETYGNYVVLHHKDSYAMRTWHSLRNDSLKFYSDASQIDDRQAKWLSSSFDAISLEEWQPSLRFISLLVRSRLFQRKHTPEVLERISSSRLTRFCLRQKARIKRWLQM